MLPVAGGRGGAAQNMLNPSAQWLEEAGVAQQVRRHPFALLVSSHAGRTDATPLPLILESDASGPFLLGHFGSTNRQIAALRQDPRALAVFQGQHGYVSPSWLSDRTQAPTWFHESVQLTVDVRILDGHEAAKQAVERLTAEMEEGRDNAWRPAEMGARLDRLARGVVAFKAPIVEAATAFKLGQREPAGLHGEIIDGLRRTGSHALADAVIGARTAQGGSEPGR